MNGHYQITFGGGSYEHPVSETVEVHSEGILCASDTQQSLYTNTHESWTEDNSFEW